MHSPSELGWKALPWQMSGLACARNSASVKLRRAFFEEGGGAFLLVFRCRADAEIGRFERKPFGLAGVHPLVSRFQRELYGDRRIGRDLLQNRLGTVNQAACRNDFVDEANAIGFLRGNRLAGEDQLQRTTLSHQTRQTLRSATAGQKAQLDFGLPKSGMLRRDPHRASHRRLAASAKRKAINGCDHRLAEIFYEVQYALPEPTGL